MLMSFYEIPRNTTHVGHTRAARVESEEQEGDSDVETALAALAGRSDIFGRNRRSRETAGL